MQRWEWIHNKTGKTYYRIGSVINATNQQEGQKMILYENDSGDQFVRENVEFLFKFTPKNLGILIDNKKKDNA